MKFRNLTPHPINLILPNKKTITFESEGVVRVKSYVKSDGKLGKIPITRTEFGRPEGLPDYEKGTYLIVSRLVKENCPDRWDLLSVNETVRNQQGKVIGCRSLSFI